MKYKPTIGLEIHLQLATKSKMFCNCVNRANEERALRPNDEQIKTNKERIFDNNSVSFVDNSSDMRANTAICPICSGQPGSLPALNQKALEMILKLGLALGGEIEKKFYFERKNYFYPDLPKGYQISQKKVPIVKNAFLEIGNKKIKIQEMHLEEDTAKSYHQDDNVLIDFNRAGVPLLEIVTAPEIENAREAKQFCEELQAIVRTLGISSANMEKGEMRCEVNVSLRPNDKQIKTNDKRIILKNESYRLMALLFEIHNKLGPVYKEKNYQDGIEEILKREKIHYEREKKIVLEFGNLKISDFFADFIIDNTILLEVKAKKFITQDDIRQTLRYIKSSGLPLGIVVNFRKDKLEYRRLINPSFDFNSLSFVEDSGELGTKVEIKNLNSFRAVERSIEHEIKRQAKVLKEGSIVVQETRGWDEKNNKTISQRVKEESEDYRYFPEPDLPFFEISEQEIERIKKLLPELPSEKRKRLIEKYGFDQTYAKILTSEIEILTFVEEVMDVLKSKMAELTEGEEIDQNKKIAKKVGDWIVNKLFGLETLLGGRFFEKIKTSTFTDFMTLLLRGSTFSNQMAENVLKKMYETGQTAEEILGDESMKKLNSQDEIKKAVELVLENYPEVVADYKKGKTNAIKYLLGQTMAATKGKTDPKELEKLLRNFLE